MSHNPALAALFSSINVGEPITARGWKLFPLYPMTPPTVHMRSARAAVAEGRARVEERTGVPSVRELVLRNLADTPVLVRDGDLFVAGRQDRVADRPLLVAANGVAEVPVSCVEANRWETRNRTDFTVAPFDVDLGVRHARRTNTPRGARPDQSQTWSAVASHRQARGLINLQGSLADSQTIVPAVVEETVASLRRIYGAAGLALCRETPQGPRVAEVTWYADPALCDETWEATVRGVVASLPTGRHAPTISRTELRALFARLVAADAHREAALSAIRHGRTAAQLLLSEERPVYFNAIHA